MLDLLEGGFDIVGFLLNFVLSGLGDGDLELFDEFFVIGITVAVFFDIRNLKVLLDGSLKLQNFLLEHSSLLGFLEGLGSSDDGTELLGLEGCFPGGIESLFPATFTGVKFLVFIFNIFELVFEVVHVLVVEVVSILGLLDVFLKDFTDIFPFLDELFALLRVPESLVEFVEVHHLLGLEPSLEGGLEISDWSGVLDLLGNDLDVVSFFLDLFLTSWAD